MPDFNPQVDAYIARAQPFARPILQKLRRLFHKACPQIEEKLKWGVPSFEYKGMIGGFAAFKQHVSWGMWKSALLNDPTGAPGGDAYRAPDFARELCDHHHLWMLTPLDVAVPILCWEGSDGQSRISAWRYHHALHDYSLNELLYTSAVPLDNNGIYQDLLLTEPGPYAIVLATALEYVATTYGAEEVPRLLSAIPAHATADTLIPALFGVSLAEFEQGWRLFLIERYELGE